MEQFGDAERWCFFQPISGIKSITGWKNWKSFERDFLNFLPKLFQFTEPQFTTDREMERMASRS